MRAVVVGIALALSGCGRYRPEPLDARAVLEGLRAVARDPVAAGFPPGDGPALTEERAVSIALVLNADLRALRARRGVADAQLLAAGLFPDPEIEARWLDRDDGSVVEAGILQEILRPGARSGRRRVAALAVEETDLETAAAEWAVAQEVRGAFTDLLAAREEVRIASEDQALRERVLALLRAREEAGSAPPLEVNAAAVDAATRRLALRAAERDAEGARIRVNRLLGVDPRGTWEPASGTGDWDVRIPAAGAERLEEVAVERRSDLAAARVAVLRAEEDLALAMRGRFPRIAFGPSFGKEEGESGFGLGVGLEIPLWNRNRGEIAERTAARDALRLEFAARVARVRADLAEALAALGRESDRVRLFEEEVRPGLERGVLLTEEALRAGRLDPVALLLVQDGLLQARRDHLQALAGRRRAWIRVEEALGARVSQIEGEGGR